MERRRVKEEELKQKSAIEIWEETDKAFGDILFSLLSLYPQFTREYILWHMTVDEATVFYVEGIRIRQQLSVLEMSKMFGSIPAGGGNKLTGSNQINENMNGDEIVKYYKSQKFDINSFSDVIFGGGP